MTSNIGSQSLNLATGIDREEASLLVMEELRRRFRPEFLNRVDEILVFNPLSIEDIRTIVDIQVHLLDRRLADRKIEISLTDRAKDLLAEEGFDPFYGARPLKRVIQREIQDALALKILNGDVSEGDVVQVDAREGEIEFEVKVPA
jgi:ATP-dependent Clp protease ATP-binding subunit ClpB